MASAPILTLCMIVRDEEANIGECLACIRDAVDEMVVVDTGSLDRTRNIARELGAKVHRFRWIEDFSAARNHAIGKATGRYVIWMDADDRLRPSERQKLVELKSHLARAQAREAFYFRVRNVKPAGQPDEFLQLRLFPRIPGARFEGRIHEQIYHVLERLGVRLSRVDIVIDHCGYRDEEANRKKAERNLRILWEELERDPENPYLRFHVANTYAVMGESERAAEQYERVLAFPELDSRFAGASSRVRLMLASSLINSGEFERGERVLLEHNAASPDVWLGRLILSELYIRQGRWSEALDLLETLEGKELAPDIHPVPLEEIPEKIRGYLVECLANLGRERLDLGDPRQAVQYLERAVGLDGRNAVNWCNLGVAYRRAGEAKRAAEAYARAIELDPGQTEARANLGHLCCQMGRLDEAVTHFSTVLESPGRWLDVRLAMAQIHWAREELDGFATDLDGVLRCLGMPRNLELQSLADLSALLDEIRERLSDDRPAAAMVDLLQSLILPKNAEQVRA